MLQSIQPERAVLLRQLENSGLTRVNVELVTCKYTLKNVHSAFRLRIRIEAKFVVINRAESFDWPDFSGQCNIDFCQQDFSCYEGGVWTYRNSFGLIVLT